MTAGGGGSSIDLAEKQRLADEGWRVVVVVVF
jgi:hypothetical protein